MSFSANAFAATVTINNFNVQTSKGSSNFDPSPQGADQDLILSYSLNAAADDVLVEIRNSADKLIKSFSANSNSKASGFFIWDGYFEGKLIEPGLYTANLIVKKSGESDVNSKKLFYAVYDDEDKPEISNFELSTSSINTYGGETMEIEFTNEEDSNLTVEIRDSAEKVVMNFSSYDGDNYDAGEDHSISWNGKGEYSSSLATADYFVYVTARNDAGVVTEKKTIHVGYKNDGSSSSSSTSNAHIADFTVTPSTFEPDEDDELKIKFDIKKDLDELRVLAVKGSKEIEIEEYEDIDEEDNFVVTWSGDEDLTDGDWKIQVKTKVGSSSLTASRTIKVDTDGSSSGSSANIEDFYLSKSKFDNEEGEFTNIIFRVDKDSEVDIVILEDGKEEDEIVEDYDVEGDRWYSVQWDGDDFDYSDDLDIKLIAKNENKKISVDLTEDEVSGSRTNITNDYIKPAVGSSGEKMTLFYELDDDADVTVTIHKGTSGSGSKVIELVDDKEQNDGEHKIVWDGRDDDDDKLSKGVYSYKIVARNASVDDTEVGTFVIGAIGEIEGKKTVRSKKGKISPNVISIDGGSGISSGDCGNFADVSSSSKYCDAIEWAFSEGIFVGYNDGTFKPYQSISRSEALKVILEALDIEILSGFSSSFNDVGKNSWYKDYVETAKYFGIFHGDGFTGKARPEATVNRAELLKFVFEATEEVGDFEVESCSDNFNDVSTGHWYYEYACEAFRYDLFDSKFLAPGTLSSRGETAYLLYKLSQEGLL